MADAREPGADCAQTAKEKSRARRATLLDEYDYELATTDEDDGEQSPLAWTGLTRDCDWRVGRGESRE